MLIEQIISDLNEAPLEHSDIGFGMTQMVNDDVALVGGGRSGNSAAGLTRLKYDIYDIKGAIEQGIEPQDNKVGIVELFVEDGSNKIDGLVNIEFNTKKRKGGLGSRVVEALLDSEFTNRPFKIYDIQQKAYGFWKKMGVEFFTDSTFSKPADKKSRSNFGLIR